MGEPERLVEFGERAGVIWIRTTLAARTRFADRGEMHPSTGTRLKANPVSCGVGCGISAAACVPPQHEWGLGSPTGRRRAESQWKRGKVDGRSPTGGHVSGGNYGYWWGWESRFATGNRTPRISRLQSICSPCPLRRCFNAWIVAHSSDTGHAPDRKSTRLNSSHT